MNIEEFDQIINILVIGNANVGKTNLVQWYTSDRYSESFPSTIGVDY